MSPKSFFPRPVSTGSMSMLALVAGGLVLGGVVWLALTSGRDAAAVEVKALAAPEASPRGAPGAPAKEASRPSTGPKSAKTAKTAARPPPAKSPNVIGGASASEREATVSAALARKLKNRARYAERLLEKEKKKTERLQGEVAELRARVEQLTKAKLPPPPTDAEEVLETLRPLLSANAGR